MAGSFVIEKDSNKKYRFSLRAGNYEKILASEAYEAKAGVDNGIASVRQNAKDDARYARKTASDGSRYFTLSATNGQVIGTSEMYSSAAAMESGIASVKTTAPEATVDDRS
jgi:uncharacterized protein YegP (UPF0339 family)